jgi:hypothetical protein
MTHPAFNIVPSKGNPKPRYFVPTIRLNGQVQDMQKGQKLDPAYLDMSAIAAAVDTDKQDLSTTNGGYTINISGSQTSVDIPALTAGTAPNIDTSASIPSDVVGTDNYLLAQPVRWLQMTLSDGSIATIPSYS